MESILTQTNRDESKTSEKYKVITTAELMKHFESLGFEQTKLVGKSKFGRHLVRMRDTRNLVPIDGGHLEVVIFNSYDGSSSLRLELGVFRLVCSNGLVAKTGSFGGTRIRHTGDVKAKVTEAVAIIRSNYEKLAAQVEKLKSIDTAKNNILFSKILPLVKEELTLRTKGDFDGGFVSVPVNRPEDKGSDLWTVLNVVQEGFVRGGIKYKNQDGQSRKLKTISNPQRLIKLNQRLWSKITEIANEAVA